MRLPAFLATLFIAIAIFIGVASAQSPSTPIAISHVTLINPATSTVEHDATVIIDGDHIGTVLIGAMVKMPGNTRLIDGHGKFLIPGLWDMHVHTAFGNWFPGGREIILPLFVANGVTGVRDMGGDLPILLAWRKQIAAGEIVGPRMVVSGPMLDADLPDGKGLRFPSSVRVTTPASAVAAVDSLKAQGADFIKVQSVISHDAYLAAAAEAKRIGLPIVGHVPDTVRLSEVIAAGQMSVEHLMGIFEGCSIQEDKFVHGQGTMEILLTTQDPARCDALFHLLVEHQVWQVPTMVWQHGGELLDQLDWNHPSLAAFVPRYWREVTWARFRN